METPPVTPGHPVSNKLSWLAAFHTGRDSSHISGTPLGEVPRKLVSGFPRLHFMCLFLLLIVLGKDSARFGQKVANLFSVSVIM